MSTTMIPGRGMEWFLGNTDGNVSQFDPTGQVSPGQSYLPDEIARMIVKEAGLGKTDTISKKAIIYFLETLGLDRQLAAPVAMVLRNAYGVTPTFDENTDMYRSGRLLEELDTVVGESYPAPFLVVGPEVLTEEEAYQAALVEEYESATDEEYRGIILALSEVSLAEAQEIFMFAEWAGEEVLDCLWELIDGGNEMLAHEVLEGLIRPHLMGRLSEAARLYIREALPKKRADDFSFSDTKGHVKVPAAKPPPETDVSKLAKEKTTKGKLKSAGKKALELGKKAKGFGHFKGTEPGLRGAAKAVGHAVSKTAGAVARSPFRATGAALGAFSGSFASQAKASYDKQKAIQRGEDPSKEKAQGASSRSSSGGGSEKKKPGLLRRAIGAIGRSLTKAGHGMAQANPGMTQTAQDAAASKKKKSGERRKGEGGAVSGLADSVARSGNLISEMTGIFDGASTIQESADEVRIPSAVIEELEANDVIDEVVLECLSEASWDELAQLATIILMPAEESFSLIRSMSEGMTAFRDEWRSVEERIDLPTGLTRSTFVTLSKISLDEGVIPKVIYWSGCALQNGGPVVEEYVRESYPELGKTVYGPAGDPREGPNITKAYMTPYEAGTYAPNAEAKVLDVRYFVDPLERKAQREAKLKEVEAMLSDMEAAAEKAGVPPEGMFLNKWRDMHRERVRYS